MTKKHHYNLITVLLLIGAIGLVIGMVKKYEIECTKQGGKAQVAKTTIRGITMECLK